MTQGQKVIQTAGVDQHSQQTNGLLWLVLSLLSKLEDEGYVMDTSTDNPAINVTTSLRAALGITRGESHVVDLLEQRLDEFVELRARMFGERTS